MINSGESSHRYIGPAGETVDVLAPAGVKPPPDLTTTPLGRTIEVYAGKGALRHRVLIRASYGGRVSYIPVPDLPRAMQLKAAAYASQWRRSQASAFDSRHLTDLVHLVTLIDDVTEVLTHLGTAPPAGHLSLADVLDNTAHHAWAAAGTAVVDATTELGSATPEMTAQS